MDAARSLESFLKEKNLSGVRLVGHSYDGMVISQLNLAPKRVTRLVYVNAKSFLERTTRCRAKLTRRPNIVLPNPPALGRPLPLCSAAACRRSAKGRLRVPKLRIALLEPAVRVGPPNRCYVGLPKRPPLG